LFYRTSSFDKGQQPIGGKPVPHVHAAADPTDFDAVDMVVPAQAKLEP
jgi:hypothetical protein